MQNIILKDEQKEIVQKASLKSLITNDYLHDNFNENLKLIAELFFDKKIERAKSFNVWSNVFKTVADTFAFFTWSPQSEVNFNSIEYIKDLVGVWEMVVWLERLDWKIVPYYIDAEDYVYADWKHKVIKYFEVIEEARKVIYMLVQVFEVGYTESKLYKLPSLLSLEWSLVDLDTIPQTEWLQERTETGLDVPAILIYSERDSTKYNQSEIDKIKNLWYSLDRKQVLFETQFLQEIEQYVLYENIDFPSDSKDKDWNVLSTKIGKKLQNNSQVWEKADIKFISNKNDLMADAIYYEEKQLWKVTSATSIPLDFLGLSTSGTTSWSSRTIMIGAFVKKVQSYRGIVDSILLKVLELWNYDNKEIIWDDIIPKSGEDLANELAIARKNGFVSQYTSVKKYLHLDNDEEIQSELDRISLENNESNNVETN